MSTSIGSGRYRQVMLTGRQTIPVLSAVVVCTLPHFLNVALWVVFACLIIWSYTVAATRYDWSIPGRFILGVVVIFVFAAAMSTHEGFTLEAFVAVLALMVSLKFLEAGSDRDRVLTVILCYFLIAAGLFFGDSIGATLYMLFSIFFTTAVLIHVNRPGRGLLPPLKLSARLMLQALPVAVVLFLLFPRIQGGLWGRAPINSARTGFSDTMSLGSIAELARNSDVAFRVEFAGDIPPQEELYWRGIVLWEFDGRTWQRGHKHREALTGTWKPVQPKEYTITLEPHNEHWLLTLDLPLRIDFRRAWLNSDHTSYRWWPITQRVRYTGISDIGANDPHDDKYLGAALELPPGVNPLARNLARSLAAESKSAADYVQQVFSYFRNRKFTYTLKPPSLTTEEYAATGNNTDLVDRFLFQSRRGLCEHFAASFAFLMRAAGIPARIVLGYQGGSRNLYGGYLVVRQSDAHAWCEIWFPGKGWVRIDPTGAVAPARLTDETVNALPPEETGILFSLMRQGPLGNWLGVTLNAWDYLNSKWNRWVMDYSPYEDFDFFIRFGLNLENGKDWGKALGIALIAAAAVMAIMMVPGWFRAQKDELDETGRAWSDFCRKLSRVGLPRRPEQGPADFLQYIAEQQPHLTKQAREIISAYIRIRYGQKESIADRMRLKSMVKRFTPYPTGPSA